MGQHKRLLNRRTSSADVGRRPEEDRVQAPLDALRAMQREVGNAAMTCLLGSAARSNQPSGAGAPLVAAQREVDVDQPASAPSDKGYLLGEAPPGAATEEAEEQPTVRLFDAVGLEIYVLGPLRRAEALVQVQEWEAAEALFPEVGQALVEFFDHYQKKDPVLSEALVSSKNYLGIVYTHVRHRQGKRGRSDDELVTMLSKTIGDLESEPLPERRPSSATDLMRPGDEEPGEAAREADGETGTARLFDDVGLEIYVLGPLRRALGKVEQQEWEAAEAAFVPIGHVLFEFSDHYRESHPALAERILGYKNFLGIIYTNIKYRQSDLGQSDDTLTQMLGGTVGELETLSKKM